MDDIDLKILQLLQQNARIANAEIARRVDMAPSAVLERIKKLEDKKYIQEYVAKLNPKAVDLGLVAFVAVKADYCDCSDAGEALARVPGVLEVYSVAGEDCYMVKIRAKDTEALGRILNEQVKTIPSIRSTKTTIVLSTIKETTSLPLPE